jgi:tRNA 2-selenouridine synthase SelU
MLVDNSVHLVYNSSIVIEIERKFDMTNFVFACGSVNGLTLAQKRETLKALRESIKAEVAAKRDARAVAKVEKAIARQAKIEAREAKSNERALKKAARIAVLEAKLEAMKNPVGSKARKANMKPSKVTVTRMAA